MGSGAILREVPAAAELLENDLSRSAPRCGASPAKRITPRRPRCRTLEPAPCGPPGARKLCEKCSRAARSRWLHRLRPRRTPTRYADRPPRASSPWVPTIRAQRQPRQAAPLLRGGPALRRPGGAQDPGRRRPATGARACRGDRGVPASIPKSPIRRPSQRRNSGYRHARPTEETASANVEENTSDMAISPRWTW